MNNNIFLDRTFLLSTKNPNDPDFDRILDFSKETHPRSISFVGRVLITVAV